MLKGLVKSVVRPLGLDVVKYPPLSPLARQLRELFERLEIDLVIDVGACDGGFVRFLRRQIGYEGQIVSFEPTPGSFRILQTNFAGDAKWRGYNMGVSDVDREATLNTYGENYDFNSLLPLGAEGARSYDVDLSKASTQPIMLRTIGSLWTELTRSIKNPKVYLKSDTQGHDPAVLRGASSQFKHILALQTEIPAVQIYDGMQSMGDAINNLARNGYVPYGFHPINKPENLNGLAAEYDVIFIQSQQRS